MFIFHFFKKVMSRSRKHSLKSSLYYADQEKCCFHLEIFDLRHLRGGGGGLSRSLLLHHGNEAGTKTTCFHRNDYIKYIKNLPVILSRLS